MSSKQQPALIPIIEEPEPSSGYVPIRRFRTVRQRGIERMKQPELTAASLDTSLFNRQSAKRYTAPG
jgi:hypothetical protein